MGGPSPFTDQPTNQAADTNNAKLAALPWVRVRALACGCGCARAHAHLTLCARVRVLYVYVCVWSTEHHVAQPNTSAHTRPEMRRRGMWEEVLNNKMEKRGRDARLRIVFFHQFKFVHICTSMQQRFIAVRKFFI